ncbi:MAG: GTP 3',8-cyclase MoaA [Bryobacterales bacterium]|nr:GTP 3',8-cyclase MoaA [Bryobacterales bacterium]
MALIDSFERLHDNLRISVTDRCNIRCFYCMPEGPIPFLEREEILSFEEIERVATVAVSLGVRKLRITGGEPLVRKDLPVLVERLCRIDGVNDVGLTTNGVLLAQFAEELWAAGLRRLNVHLDTLDAERFTRITRRDDFGRVMAGLDRALELGFDVKINAVAAANLCEPDVVPLALFGRERGVEIRYIEFMPLDAQGLWKKSKVLLQDSIMEMLRKEIGELIEIPDQDPRAPATEYRFADGVGRVGFISSVSRPFCMNCNRLRLTSDGKMRYCLFAIEELDVKEILRSGGSDAELAEVIQETVRRKWIGHEIQSQKFVAPPRPMYSIGG